MTISINFTGSADEVLRDIAALIGSGAFQVAVVSPAAQPNDPPAAPEPANDQAELPLAEPVKVATSAESKSWADSVVAAAKEATAQPLEEPPAKRGRGRPPKIRPVEVEPVVEAEVLPEEEETPVVARDTGPMTFEECRRELLNLAEDDPTAVRPVLEAMGYSKLSDVPEDRRREVIENFRNAVRKGA